MYIRRIVVIHHFFPCSNKAFKFMNLCKKAFAYPLRIPRPSPTHSLQPRNDFARLKRSTAVSLNLSRYPINRGARGMRERYYYASARGFVIKMPSTLCCTCHLATLYIAKLYDDDVPT